MKLTALIATLIIGSSSAAMASPDTSVNYDYDDEVQTLPAPAITYPAPAPAYRPSYPSTQPTYPDSSYNRWYRPRWVSLGSVNHIVDGEMEFYVNSHRSQFNQLKLQSMGGKTLVYRVEIEFANGRTRTVEVNQYLLARNPSITIDIPGRNSRDVRKVTVIGRNARQSSYRVLAV